jgi:ABC-type transporter Mla maintaining outer membrane lipid asymmetry ATPase subunit MlaF
MIHKGKLVASAPPEEFRNLEDPRVQQFIHGRAEGPLSDEPSGQPKTPGR